VTRLALLALAAALLAGCGGGGDDTLVVYADSDLGDLAQELDTGATVVRGSSAELAGRIRDGADADVFLSRSGRPLDDLRGDGLVDSPAPFAANRLVIIVPRVNRAKVNHIVDLTRKGLKLVLGKKGVPVGDLARQSLELAGLGAALDNVVGVEKDAKGVVDQVVQGKADAAIVYATDAGPVGRDVQVFDISSYFQPEIRYDAAAVAPASDKAKAYLEKLAGDDGYEAVVRAGLLPALPS
jgi:molybdate transport system substrate-binding protein